MTILELSDDRGGPVQPYSSAIYGQSVLHHNVQHPLWHSISCSLYVYGPWIRLGMLSSQCQFGAQAIILTVREDHRRPLSCVQHLHHKRLGFSMLIPDFPQLACGNYVRMQYDSDVHVSLETRRYNFFLIAPKMHNIHGQQRHACITRWLKIITDSMNK